MKPAERLITARIDQAEEDGSMEKYINEMDSIYRHKVCKDTAVFRGILAYFQ